MALSLPEKMDRVLCILLAVRDPHVASALALHGFRKQDHDEGWTLLRAVGDANTTPMPLSHNGLPQRLLDHQKELARAEAELWAWYVHWSDVAHVAIKRPALREQLGLPSPHPASALKDAEAAHDDEPVSATSD